MRRQHGIRGSIRIIKADATASVKTDDAGVVDAVAVVRAPIMEEVAPPQSSSPRETPKDGSIRRATAGSFGAPRKAICRVRATPSSHHISSGSSGCVEVTASRQPWDAIIADAWRRPK
jgi:hypothetical protein